MGDAGWHVALLRSVNVGGRNSIAMAALRDFAGQLGLLEARTLLQSGNLVFRLGRRPGAGLERLLEREARALLSLETAFFVRTAEEWTGVITSNPFPAEAKRDPAHLVVVVLKEPPGPGTGQALREAVAGRETLQVVGREAYVFYPDGIGNSRLTISLIERKLGTAGTARNWNTVLKLGALAPPLGR
jgi:uncharacterized protein (DUF1697 family)